MTTSETSEATPQQLCDAVLAELAADQITLTEAHTRMRAVKRRPAITTAAVLEQTRGAVDIDHADTAALVGASASAAFTGLTAEQVSALEQIVASGGMRRPYRLFPWSPPPKPRTCGHEPSPPTQPSPVSQTGSDAPF